MQCENVSVTWHVTGGQISNISISMPISARVFQIILSHFGDYQFEVCKSPLIFKKPVDYNRLKFIGIY